MDASLVGIRAGSTSIREGPPLIIVEDKQLGVDDGEYQIPGDMLATAYHNYVDLKMRYSQTIFAMRVIGMHIFYYACRSCVMYIVCRCLCNVLSR